MSYSRTILILSIISPVLISAPAIAANNPNPLNDHFLRAVSSGDMSLVKDDLAKGADINAQGINGDFALQTAVNLANNEMFTFLLNKGADVNLKDDFGETALISAAKNDRIEVIKPLLAHHADVHADHDAALMTAVDHQQLDIIRQLVAAGADPNARNKEGQSILMHAIGGSPVITRIILDAGAKLDANDSDNAGVTLVMDAANGCAVDAVKMLLSRGANIKAIDHDGNTALLQLPLNSFGESAPAISEMIQFLVGQGVDVNAKNKADDTALLQSVHQHVTEAGGRMAHANVVRSLLAAGADIKSHDADGNTALHLIVRAIPPNPEVAALLVDHGADLNALNQDGQTPLILAAQACNLQAVLLLVSKHADRTIRGKDGLTAMEIAKKAKLQEGISEERAEGLSKIISILSAQA